MNAVASTTTRQETGCGKLYVTLGSDGTVRTQLGKAGGCASCQVEAQARLVTLAMEHGATRAEVIAVLSGIGCQHHVPAAGKRSCPDALAEGLR